MKKRILIMFVGFLVTLLSALNICLKDCNVSDPYSHVSYGTSSSYLQSPLLFSYVTYISFTDDFSSFITADDFEEMPYSRFSGRDNGYLDLVADISQSGSLCHSFRIMIKSALRLFYQSSTLWAKDAIRRIARYIQNKCLISEESYSKTYRVGRTGEHMEYIYLLCRIVI